MRKQVLVIGLSLVLVALVASLVQTPSAQAAKGTVDYNTWGIGAFSQEEKTGCLSQPGTWIDNAYMEIWKRHARCDEVTFHLRHKTPRATLEAWLQKVKLAKLANAYGGNTFVAPPAGSTSGNVTWWFDHAGVAHRVNDWPTMMSWGLLVDDHWTLPASELGFWNRVVPKASDLKFTDGNYYNEVITFWRDSTYTPQVPTALKTPLLADGHTHYGFLKYKTPGFSKCNSWFPDRTAYKYLDWSYANVLNETERANCNDW